MTQYLIKGLDPEFWVLETAINWTAPHLPSRARTAINLSSTSSYALALSGKPEAALAMKEVMNRGSKDPQQAAIMPSIDQALKELEKVQQMGLRQYSEQESP